MEVCFHCQGKPGVCFLCGKSIERKTQETGRQVSNEKRGAPGGSFRVIGRARFWSCTPHSKRLFLCILNIVSYGFGNTRGQGPRFVPLGAVFLSLSEMWHMSKPVIKVLRFFEFLGHTWNMCKPVMTFVFKELRNRLLRYILETCPNLWWRSCSQCYTIDCFGTYLEHVQTCDDVCAQRAMQSSASVHTWNMSWSRMLCNPVKRCLSCT